MYGRRIGTTVVLVCVAACASAADATAANNRDEAYAQRAREPIKVAGDPHKKIRGQSSEAKKFDKPVSKGQTIYVKLLDAAEVKFLGRHWTTQSQKEQMKDSMVKRIRKMALDRLLYEGFVAYAYEEMTSNNDQLPDDAIVLEIHLEKLRYGAQQHIAAISVRIYDLKDPTFEYGTYLDGGTVNKMSLRIARRFALSADGKK